MVEVVVHSKENKSHLYQPGDDLERFLVHIHTCKKNEATRRKLEKYLPSLYRLLEKGKVAPDEIISDVMAVYDR